MNMSFDKDRVRVAIVGAGVGGLSTAIALKTQLSFDNFIIYEKADGIGGTWWHNTYPGCGSDAAAHWYSLSTDLNPNWTSFLASQPELLAYWSSLTEKYSLRPHISLSTSVDYAEWDVNTKLYRITLRNVQTGTVWYEEAEVIVGATGALSVPAFPTDTEGNDAFKGETFHSAEWRHDVSLSGKRVGVIGNGCSAAQLVPEIAKDESVQVINFCRTPQWFFPRFNFTYPTWVKWMFSRVPLLMRFYRIFTASRYEIAFAAFQNAFTWSFGFIARRIITNYMKENIPEKYWPQLLPDYPLGCKRLIFDNGYLESLHRPNVSITFERIAEIVPEGVRLRNGEVAQLDVIVFATGFDTTSIGPKIVGRRGETLQEYFQGQGGPTAYLGTTVPGFPNYFMLMGPNTTTGHASVIFTEEAQINYTVQLLRPIISHKAHSLEALESACNKYNVDIQRRISKTVFTGCSSWYRTAKEGKNAHIFPGPVSLFWWWTLWPRWSDYVVAGGDGGIRSWERERRLRRTMKYFASGGIVALLYFRLYEGTAGAICRKLKLM